MSFTPCCKVCQDAGKPESVFRSHFTRETRDPSSRIVCPTLLSQECRYCAKKGHTVKYCPALKKPVEKPKPKSKPMPKKAPAQKKPVNLFSCLESDDDESDNESVEEFPALPALSQTTYASVLANPKKEKVVVVEEVVIPVVVKPVIERKLAPWSQTTVASSNKWAAMDSDSEDEEDNSAW